jgi:putative salt-induced outer membrane protein YdiY
MRARLATFPTLFLLSVLTVTPALAQEEPAEEVEAVGRRWENSTELALVQTGGNSESFTFSLRDRFTWNWEKASWVSDLFALRAESTTRLLINEDGEVRETSNTELTGEQYALSSKYYRNIRERLDWYGDLAWEQNQLAGLDSRLSVGAGIAHVFVDNGSRKFQGEIGLGFRDEAPVKGPSESFGFGRLYGRYERTITETSGFETDLELITSLEDTSNYVANFLAAVTARISAKMALKMSYTLEYRGQPIVTVVPGDTPDEPDGLFEFGASDSILSASLVIAF